MLQMVVLLSLALSVSAASGLHKDVRVEQFPGFGGTMPAKHYAGEVVVSNATGKRLFYYFATSERSPATDPLVLWLNGGPGCTSMDGFLNEHGPFQLQFTESGALVASAREHAWTKIANVIYLDSPSGVGLSYSETVTDYVTNDTQTALDTLTFLEAFFREFPEFSGNRFYITGESYGGIYVPMLANTVFEHNAKAEGAVINLQGYAIGNGCTDPVVDNDAILPYAFRHTLLSDAAFAALEKACSGNFWNITPGSMCAELAQQAYAQLEGLNIYNIQLPCLHHRELLRKLSENSLASERGWPLPGGLLKIGRQAHNWATLSGSLGISPPCLDHQELWAWANDPEVRKAIHAAPVEVAGRFDECAGRIRYTHDAGSMVHIHQKLVAAGIEVLIYSGDQDLCVPYTGSEAWTSALGLPLKAAWHPWHVSSNQIAGYKTEYQGLTFATVLGAGHAVPQLRGAAALRLLSDFLDQGLGPSSTNAAGL